MFYSDGLNVYSDLIVSSYVNDIEVLNEYFSGTNISDEDCLRRLNLLGGILKNSPKSFTEGSNAFSFIAIPVFGKYLDNTPYSLLTQLGVSVDEQIFRSYLEESVRTDRGIVSYTPHDMSVVKTTINNWTEHEYGNKTTRLLNASFRMSEAILTARDLYVALVQVFGADGLRLRLDNVLNGYRRAGETKKLDYGIFIPKSIHSTGKAFKAIKRINDSLMDISYPHLNLPSSENEFNIRVVRTDQMPGEYLINCQKELTMRLRKKTTENRGTGY